MSAVSRAASRAVHPRFFYGWYIALAGGASSFLLIGTAIFGFGVFIEPMRKEMGWSLAAISLGFSLRSFEQGLLAPVSGILVDRLGPRRMALTGVFITATGLFMFSRAHSLPVYYAASLTIALGQSVGAFTAFSAALMNWFDRKRGRAMGLMNSGSGAGYLMAPLLATLIGIFGWRETLVIASVVVASLGTPLALLLYDRPQPYGFMPDGDPPPPGRPAADSDASASAQAPPAPSASGMAVGEALRTPTFYLLAVATGVSGAGLNAWIVHQIPHLQNVGFSLGTAALIGGLYGVFQIGMRLGTGWAADFFGRRRVYIAAFLLQGVGLVIFANLDSSRVWMLPFYYLTYAFGHAAWIVVQMTMVADYFGTRRFATLRGLTSTLQMPLGVASPVIAGWMFDQTGSYQVIFTIYGLIAASGAVWVLMIRRQPWSEAGVGPA